MTSQPEAQARLDGQMAALRKEPVTDNPHPLNTSVSRAWAKGWREINGDIPARFMAPAEGARR
jgi:hypothetical protein